jgi:predicted transposase YbfD/YdcC
MERERTENGARSRETIYYLSSVEKDEASYYAMRIRAHWGIENKLHWHLDVTFREDMCRVRAKNGAVNFSAMRKYALSRTINSALNEDAKNVCGALNICTKSLRIVKSHASAL